MKRMINIILVLFLFVFMGWGGGRLFAQDTSPVPSSFAIPKANTWTSTAPQQNLTKWPSSLILRSTDVKLVAYSVTRVSPIDSVFYPDTLIALAAIGGETRYLIRLDSIGYGYADERGGSSQDSIAYVFLRKITPLIDSSAVRIVWLNKANRNVVDNLGFTFNLSRMLKQQIEVDLLYDLPAAGDVNGRIRARTVFADDDDSLLVIDKVTRTIVFMDWEQHMVHADNTFFVSDTAGTNANAFLDLVMVTPADSTLQYHLVYLGGGTDAFSIEFYEGVADSTDGDTLTNFNRRRDGINTSDVVVLSNPTHYNTPQLGTRLQAPEFIGAGNNSGGQSRGGVEWPLKPNTRYLIRNTSYVASNKLWTVLNWYEVTNKE